MLARTTLLGAVRPPSHRRPERSGDGSRGSGHSPARPQAKAPRRGTGTSTVQTDPDRPDRSGPPCCAALSFPDSKAGRPWRRSGSFLPLRQDLRGQGGPVGVAFQAIGLRKSGCGPRFRLKAQPFDQREFRRLGLAYRTRRISAGTDCSRDCRAFCHSRSPASLRQTYILHLYDG